MDYAVIDGKAVTGDVPQDICPKCEQAIEPGAIVVGASWNGEGGEHLECPEQPIILETNEEERTRLAQELRASLAEIERF